MQLIDDLDNLNKTIATHERVVVVFSARDWCVPCRRLHPHALAAAERLPGIYFVEVDIDKSEDIRQEYDVMSVPTVIAFQDGTVNKIVVGRTAPQLIAELS